MFGWSRTFQSLLYLIASQSLFAYFCLIVFNGWKFEGSLLGLDTPTASGKMVEADSVIEEDSLTQNNAGTDIG